MKTVLLAIMCVAVWCGSASAQVCSPSAEQFVAAQILNKDVMGSAFGVGWGEQAARSQGDCLASALMLHLRLTDLDDARTARAVVQALQYAFADPSHVVVAQNRQPRAALLLLDIVAWRSNDTTARLRATELLNSLMRNPPEVPQEKMSGREAIEGIGGKR